MLIKQQNTLLPLSYALKLLKAKENKFKQSSQSVFVPDHFRLNYLNILKATEYPQPVPQWYLQNSQGLVRSPGSSGGQGGRS